jgi:hypothetical protein
MHLSSAGDYIDKVLDDMEEIGVLMTDGTTEIGSIISLRLHNHRTKEGQENTAGGGRLYGQLYIYAVMLC